MKQLAVIRYPRFGVTDYGVVGLSFETYISESEAAGQTIDVKAAEKLIKEYGIDDVNKLNNKVCWVEIKGTSIMFVGSCVIK